MVVTAARLGEARRGRERVKQPACRPRLFDAMWIPSTDVTTYRVAGWCSKVPPIGVGNPAGGSADPVRSTSAAGKSDRRSVHSTPAATSGRLVRAATHSPANVSVTAALAHGGVGGPFPARSLLGVYPLWQAAHTCDLAVKDHWPAVVERVGPVLAKGYTFDPKKAHQKDEAERLTGDLAGLIGFVRLARSPTVRDREAEKAGLSRLRQVLELRVNLDRVNPRVLEPTDSTTAKSHAAKPARYCGLVPEVGAALARHTGGAAGQRLAAFREPRPGWWLAAGDRLIGGENYCGPPHLSRSLFASAALIEGVPAADLAGWVDVPWCAADLYFVEKAALALRGG